MNARYLVLILIVAATALPARFASAAPQITGLSDTSLDRSGRLLIFGSGFGATQGAGQVTVGGLDASVGPARWTSWTSTR